MGRIVILSSVLLIVIFSCQRKKQFDEINQIITETKQEFAPDSRTAIFEIKIITTTPIMLQGETNLPEAKTRLLEQLKESGFEFNDQIKILPGETLGKEKHGIINVSVANLRSLPKHSAELVTQAILGTPVALLKKTDGWYLVQTPDQYIAWTNDASLVSMDEEQFNEWGKDEKIIYLDTYGFSYSNEDNHRVSDLVAGSILRLEQENHDFWQILYPDGRKAKISKNEAKNFQSWYSEIEVSDQSITSAAEDLMGVPYLWGGTSTKGVDCSGFTKTVYFLQGLVLPRDASQQAAVGELIDTSKEFSKLIIGDLLFFGKINEDQTEHVVHVGLWLGNNKYIHASGDVHISSMDPLDENFDQYNYNRYLRSKRIIGTPQISVKNVLTSD